MGKKNKKDRINVVYSTDPDFEYQFEDNGPEETLKPEDQPLRVSLDRKKRKGKEVTLITGFSGSELDCAALGKTLKKACGVGGSVKEGEILIQGDHRQKVLNLLLDAGYKKSRLSGG